MLGDISGLEKIYIVCGYTDMRKSIDGLCAIIEDQLKMDPTSSALFLFCGRRRDRIKALFREPDGFVLLYKMNYYSSKILEMLYRLFFVPVDIEGVVITGFRTEILYGFGIILSFIFACNGFFFRR